MKEMWGDGDDVAEEGWKISLLVLRLLRPCLQQDLGFLQSEVVCDV